MRDDLERLRAALAGRYVIEEELGRGGMAIVYRASDVRHHRTVAIRVFAPELAAALGPDRFLREIGIAARLSHPHIVPLFDSGQADGLLFYVMPCVMGESLRQRLRREKQHIWSRPSSGIADTQGLTPRSPSTWAFARTSASCRPRRRSAGPRRRRGSRSP
jgi:serine/threonine protein kinase